MVGVSGPPKKKGSSDDFQTPPNVLDMLIPYLKKEWLIWEPACGKGNLVNELKKQGFKVLGSDISGSGEQDQDMDFLGEHDGYIESWDCIVTNPPYTTKDKFLQRCYELGKPFALLLPITALESEKRQKFFRKYGIQLIIPNRRINFETPSGMGGGAWFPTAWFTWGLNLPSDLNFVELNSDYTLKEKL